MKKKEKKQSEQNNEEVIREDNSIEIERSEPEEKTAEETLSEPETAGDEPNV